jgi:hypothetical protein
MDTLTRSTSCEMGSTFAVMAPSGVIAGAANAVGCPKGRSERLGTQVSQTKTRRHRLS